MSEAIVNALVHLFAIFESVKEDFDEDSGALVVKPYLKKNLNEELTKEYLNLFYDYLSFYKEANSNPSGDHELGIDSTSIIQIAKICNQINKELNQASRILVFIELLELIRADGKISDKESEFASLVAMNFNLNHKEVEDIIPFVFNPEAEKVRYSSGLIIDNRMTEWPEEVAWMMRKKKAEVPGSTKYHHMYIENLFGRIFVLYIESVDEYIFRYDGPLNLYLEGNKVSPKKSYFIRPGAIIKGPNIKSIYETEITKQFLKEKSKVKIVMTGEDLMFHFKNSTNGIQNFNFSEESGNLVGIMGGSGTGKSTLLNLLNGKIDPTSGRVHINGYSIGRAGREGVIGYVPQDDLLFEELTVYQNLYFNARICFSDFSPSLLKNTVDKVLNDLGLEEIKDLKVGDPLNKTISGGQRKRLNIALELMREPSVLFVDEPTSGLSSTDSLKVMWLLKDLARKGKLVIAIIHQPSSEIYKLLDKLWLLDKGGFPIYNGNPIDAVVYFKTMSMQVNAAESECPRCGNVIPDQILEIIEAKEIDDQGREIANRKVAPRSWYIKYRENIEKNLKRIRFNERLPASNFSIPSKIKQWRIYSRRNFISKLSNKQYILINALEAPFLAFILSYFSKYVHNSEYIFSENKNFPVFLFMAVVVSLFMGMSVSAEEIFKDRKILERESFLNLSRMSYLNSKIFWLFCLSAFQTMTFVLISSWILEIDSGIWEYWVIIFTTSCFANLVGLNISSALNSIIAIYILIPFILVPQLLLGGAMIKFDDLNPSFTNKKYVPIVGDLMVSRWSYEALAISQFKHNDYQKFFFDVDQQLSESSFQSVYIIPKLETLTKNLIRVQNKDKYPGKFELLRNQLQFISKQFKVTEFPLINSLYPEYFNQSIGNRVLAYIERINEEFQNRNDRASKEKDSIYLSLVNKLGQESFYEINKDDIASGKINPDDSLYARMIEELGEDELLELKRDHFNESLSDVVLNRANIVRVYDGDDLYIQKKDPIYTLPLSNYGRAHFYSPVKTFGNFKFDTVWFNVTVMWLLTVFLYWTLLNDYIRKILEFISNITRTRN